MTERHHQPLGIRAVNFVAHQAVALHKVTETPLIREAIRFGARKYTDSHFPTELVDPQHNIARAKQLLQEGYGEILIINHFAKDDLIRPFSVLFRDREFAKRPAVAPIGMHEATPEILDRARAAGIQLIPVANKTTVREWGKEGKKVQIGQGIHEFFDATKETLSKGGLVLLAAQGGRKPSLGEPEGTMVMSTLMRMKDAEKVAVVFMGLSLTDSDDYNQRDYHEGERYTIKVGPVLTREELYEQVPGEDEFAKNNNLQVFSVAQLRELVAPSYAA